MSAKSNAVLAIGVKADHVHNEDAVKKFAMQEKAKAKDAGFELDFFLIDTKGGTSVVEQLKEKLRSQLYDGIVIGFGVRGNAALTETFELIVNTCAQEINPIPKFIFNSKPEDTTEAIQRVFMSA